MRDAGLQSPTLTAGPRCCLPSLRHGPAESLPARGKGERGRRAGRAGCSPHSSVPQPVPKVRNRGKARPGPAPGGIQRGPPGPAHGAGLFRGLGHLGFLRIEHKFESAINADGR